MSLDDEYSIVCRELEDLLQNGEDRIAVSFNNAIKEAEKKLEKEIDSYYNKYSKLLKTCKDTAILDAKKIEYEEAIRQLKKDDLQHHRDLHAKRETRRINLGKRIVYLRKKRDKLYEEKREYDLFVREENERIARWNAQRQQVEEQGDPV